MFRIWMDYYFIYTLNMWFTVLQWIISPGYYNYLPSKTCCCNHKYCPVLIPVLLFTVVHIQNLWLKSRIIQTLSIHLLKSLLVSPFRLRKVVLKKIRDRKCGLKKQTVFSHPNEIKILFPRISVQKNQSFCFVHFKSHDLIINESCYI